MSSKEEDIKLLTEYLLSLLAEQNTKQESYKEANKTAPNLAAEKTMRQLNEAYGVEAEIIRKIIKRANELKGYRSDHTTRWDNPLWDENV